MRKFDFKKLALVGITGGVMCATHVNGAAEDQHKTDVTAPTTTTHAKMDEATFMGKLNAETKDIFQKMTAEGKTLALKLGNSGEYKDMNDAVKTAHKQLESKTHQTHETTK